MEAKTTIRVYHAGFGDPILINEEDFDPAIHERVTDESEAARKAPKPLTGKLPEDFPGFAALVEAGIHTYAQILKARAEGVKIPNIGDVIGGQIDQALAAGSPWKAAE